MGTTEDRLGQEVLLRDWPRGKERKTTCGEERGGAVVGVGWGGGVAHSKSNVFMQHLVGSNSYRQALARKA